MFPKNWYWYTDYCITFSTLILELCIKSCVTYNTSANTVWSHKKKVHLVLPQTDLHPSELGIVLQYFWCTDKNLLIKISIISAHFLPYQLHCVKTKLNTGVELEGSFLTLETVIMIVIPVSINRTTWLWKSLASSHFCIVLSQLSEKKEQHSLLSGVYMDPESETQPFIGHLVNRKQTKTFVFGVRFCLASWVGNLGEKGLSIELYRLQLER